MDITDPEMKVKRNDRSEVVDLIIDDLGHAIDNLPAFKELSTEEEGRISKEGAQAFLSRVALYEGTWQKSRNNNQNTERTKNLLDIAAKAARTVMDAKYGYSFRLFGTDRETTVLGDSAQKYMFILENEKSNPAGIKKSANHEYIFARRHDQILASIGKNITQECLANVQWITRKFANLYLCDDGLPIDKSDRFQKYDEKVSEFLNRDNRMRYTMMRPHDNFWNNQKPRTSWDGKDKNPYISNFVPKTGTGYHNQKWATERKVEDKKEGYDFPIIRYAEVLLNYAEAVYERDDKISNTDLNISLNLVRLRVNPAMTPLTNELITQNAGMDMRTEIRRERTIELFNEGFRLDDLKRWKTAETEMPMDIVGIQWKGTEYEKVWANCPYETNAEGCIIIEKGRKWEEKNYLFPLPSDQLQLNPNLQQNPGWE